MKVETERKTVKIIILTIFFLIMLLMFIPGLNDLNFEINYNKKDGAITEGKIIKIEYDSNWPSKKNKRVITKVLVVQYTVNGKNYTLEHRNSHSWEKNYIKEDKVGDIKDVRYNINNPNKADLVPTAGYYVAYILLITVFIIGIFIYIIAIVFIVRDGKYS